MQHHRQILILVAALLLAPVEGRGEGFVDFAIGGSFTRDSDTTFDDVAFDSKLEDSVSSGARGGYWFDAVPWLGVGGMVSYFQPDIEIEGVDDRDVTVIPLTALLMLRAPLLPSDNVPRGRLQPYLNVGPGAFLTQVEDEDVGADVGVDVHAGLTWMFTSRFGMFGEYRFTHYQANVEDGLDVDVGGTTFTRRVDFESTLDTHHVLTGFAWHFD